MSFSSHATVRTERAARYLTQLAGHTTRMSHGIRTLHRRHEHGDGDGAAPPEVRRVEGSETRTVIDFGRGRCTVHATGEGLTLRAEAEDARQLQRIQDGVAKRLERIGRRDGLTVTWRPGPVDGPPDGELSVRA